MRRGNKRFKGYWTCQIRCPSPECTKAQQSICELKLVMMLMNLISVVNLLDTFSMVAV